MTDSANAHGTSAGWRILALGSGPDGALWHWEQHSASRALLRRSPGFRKFDDCLNDAMAHGYRAAGS